MANYSTIQWGCAGGGSTSSRIEGVTSSTALNTLALAIEAHSNAAYSGYRMYTENATAREPVNAIFQGKGDRALIVMKDENNDIVKLGYPAPIAADIIFVNGRRVVEPTAAAALSVALATATGKTLTVQSSKFRSKNGSD